MAYFHRTLGKFAFCTVSALVVFACGGASETDDSATTAEDIDGGPDGADDDGADDDGSNGGEEDDDVTGPDISVDDDVSADDDVVADDDGADDVSGDDDGTASDDDVSDDMDASVGDGSVEPPIDGLPGDGFVTIETGDGGTFEILCGTAVCACADNDDNDGDGLMDGADSECTGPFDNDETTFATGIPGDNRDPKWQDCFFDGNSGAGDDDCRYHTDCLTGDIPLDDPECLVTEQCRDYCAPLTPPGCDCFGCCEIPLDDGSTVHVVASDTCSIANIDDEQACQRCVPTDVCGNECGECEICIGETLADLPESCLPDEPPDGSGGSGMGGGTSSGGSGNGGSGTGGNTSPGGNTSSGGSDTGEGGTGGSEDPPDEPPPNVCDGNAIACVDSDDCGSGQYCSLGCCKTLPAR